MTSVKLCPKCTQAIEQDKREKARERNRRWRERNPDRAKEQNRARSRRWVEANPTRHKELRRKWEDANRDKIRGYDAQRKARQRNAFVEDVDRMVLYERDGGHCQLCYKPVAVDAFHVDHTIPLSKGGEHSYANCQIAHPLCNQQKRAKVI